MSADATMSVAIMEYMVLCEVSNERQNEKSIQKRSIDKKNVPRYTNNANIA